MKDVMKHYTVYYCDTFDGTRWHKTYKNKDTALLAARRTAGEMLTAHVDDPNGKLIAKFGTY